jgi:hypothetical protein
VRIVHLACFTILHVDKKRAGFEHGRRVVH